MTTKAARTWFKTSDGNTTVEAIVLTRDGYAGQVFRVSRFGYWECDCRTVAGLKTELDRLGVSLANLEEVPS